MNRTIVPLLTGTLLALAACRRATPTTENRATPSASAVAVSPASARSRPAAAPSGSAPMTAAEIAATKRYLEALGQGRARTRKKDFAGAVTSFDQALKELPNNARALAERGFARLQTGDLDGAERDMHAALRRAPDRTVLSATTYNLALVAEQRGDKELAQVLRAEAMANQSPASAQAACDAGFWRGESLWPPEAMKSLTSLRQVRDELKKYADEHSQTVEPPLPTTDDETELRRLLLGDKPGPWELITGDNHHLLFGQPGDYRLRIGVLEERYSRCGSMREMRILIEGGHVLATSLFYTHNPSIACVSAKGNDVHECGSTNAADDVPVQLACYSPTTQTRDVTIYDAATGARLLSVSHERVGEAEPALVMLRPDGVQLLGGGCNQFEPFVAPAPAASGQAAPVASGQATPMASGQAAPVASARP